MSNILDQLADYARVRVQKDRESVSLEALKELCAGLGSDASPDSGNRFEAALRKPGMSFICEVKRASPSKGLISPDFPYIDIASEYQSAGADCISCLTEPKWFLGSDDIFREIRKTVQIPMIRKDFTVDEYQIYQARVMGADAVLLICALLDTAVIAEYLEICDRLNMAAVVEAHDAKEIASAVSAGARIIGVNNRNLKDFSVDFENATRLRDQIPPDCIYIAESGVRSPADAAALHRIGADAVLMGEVLMRASDRKQLLAEMRGACA